MTDKKIPPLVVPATKPGPAFVSPDYCGNCRKQYEMPAHWCRNMASHPRTLNCPSCGAPLHLVPATQ